MTISHRKPNSVNSGNTTPIDKYIAVSLLGLSACLSGCGSGSSSGNAGLSGDDDPAASPAQLEPVPLFVNATADANLEFVGSVGPAFNELTGKTEALLQQTMGNGAAVGDYDNDGDLDIYLLGQSGFPNRLYRNNLESGQTGFSDVTPPALADTGLSRVAHFVDLNNDGLSDLLLLNDDNGDAEVSGSKIFKNMGAGNFEDVTATSNFSPTGYLRNGTSLADFDLDGYIDIYITNWSLINPDVVFPGASILYKNSGNFSFQDVTKASNLELLATSFTSIFTDFNLDRFPDLLVAVDGRSDEFYWNNAGLFGRATLEVGATHVGNDMGLACADFDNDGDLDVYATNITDPSGEFGARDPTGETGPASGNAFYVNQQNVIGETQFVDEAESRGVADTYWGWGTEFIDVENDGDLDLVAVTGFDHYVKAVSTQTTSPLYQTPSVLFINDGEGSFTRLSGSGLDEPLDSRALIAFDYDRDGDQDLLITNVDQPVRLLENRSAHSGNWLEVVLSPDSLAIGATVYATTGPITRRRDVIAGRSYLSGTPSEVHFGLGDAENISTLRIVWSNGAEQSLSNVEVNQVIRVAAQN